MRLMDKDAFIEQNKEIINREIEHPKYQESLLELIEDAPTITDPTWIPCSDRLPDDDGRYLVRVADDFLSDYSEFSEIEIVPFEIDCEGFGYWVDRFDPVSLGFVDSDWNEIPVIAWMPLPDPFKE